MRAALAAACAAPLLGLPGAVAAREAPAASVPLPPPAPPERPQDLTPPVPPGEALQSPPLPPERPEALKPGPDAQTAKPPASAPDIAPPVQDAGKPAEAAPLPPPRPPELSGDAALALKVTLPDDTACRVRLKRLGVSFEPLPPISNGQCGAPLPLKVTALEGVSLPQSATLTCVAAEALARWATEVEAIAVRDLKGPLRTLVIGTSYECRGQNHDVDAKLSEHAFANGIDVMSFGIEGRPTLPVVGQTPGSDEGRFLDAVRARACAFFRTVLGPGSDAAHANHFHLDERERGHGHRLCQ